MRLSLATLAPVALAALLLLPAGRARAIDVTAMYRGSCQVDTGVLLEVDNKSVVFLGLDGTVRRIPRYEIVGMASYPLPGLPVREVSAPPGVAPPFYELTTYRDEHLTTLAVGWPIEYNAEHIQVLTRDGQDHLVARDDIWGARAVTPPARFELKAASGLAPGVGQSYRLRHPLAFEKCSDNVVRLGEPPYGDPVPVIPQTTYDNPIVIKRYHDHLRDGLAKVRDYEDRQRFYAVPQYYGNRTLLGTWGLMGSRYANVGARQVNFLPLVQDELSEGPFGFQRILRSGVSPLAWGLHEEPTVQVFYGLKADYVHLEVFLDPTAPLIGGQYNYQKGQLNGVDDRLVEKGGLEFGFDFGYASIFLATSDGNMAVRAHDYFADDAFNLTRFGLSGQYNFWRAGFYLGKSDVVLDRDRDGDLLKESFRFLKVFGKGRLGPRLRVAAQLIDRRLEDESPEQRAVVHYESRSQTVAVQTDYDLTYRWTVYVLASIEEQKARARAGAAAQGLRVDGTVDELYPKLSTGATVTF